MIIGGGLDGVCPFRARNQNYPLRRIMVDHDHKSSMIAGEREVRDEVACDESEQSRAVDRLDGLERRFRGMRVDLHLLASGAALDICRNKPPEAWPVEVVGY